MNIEKIKRSFPDGLTAVKVFNEHDFMERDAWSVGDDVWCLHCEQWFKVEIVKFDVTDNLLICPNVGCDGTMLDFWEDEGFGG